MQRIAMIVERPRGRGGIHVLALGVALSPLAPSAHAKIHAAWVELAGPNGTPSARVINDGEACPKLRVDGEDVPTTLRLEKGIRLFPGTKLPKNAGFPVRICEAKLKRGAKSAVLDDGPETRQIPLPPDVINRVVVLGDTGCRVAKKHKLQKCDDAAWPFEDVAKHAADAVPKPDLVIHLGDYLYREEDGYGWTTWQEDFFKPAKHLLAAAPWIMIRGNHETCSRAAEGWFRFLDGPKPTGSICPDMSKSFVVDLGGGFGIVVMDSASVAHTGEDDADEDEDEVPEQSPGPPVNWKSRLVANYNAIKGSIPRNAWLATHLTFNGIRIAKKQNTVDNFMLQNAVGQILSSNVKLNVSGHIHLFEALNFSDKRRPQLVVGTGGTKLAKAPEHLDQFKDLPLKQPSLVDAQFGYMVWTRRDNDGASWDGELFDPSGNSQIKCQLDGQGLDCK
jgi:hypothetical protein